MSRVEDATLSDFERLIDSYVSEVKDSDYSSSGNILDREGKKHYIETSARNVSFRLAAAEYHHNRIVKLVDEHMQQMRILMNSFPSSMEKNRATLTVREQDWRIVFELMAFLTSARSALDFLAKTISRYLKGVEFSSIRRMRKYLNTKKVPGVSELVDRH